ncbi:hypothetical protein JZU51_01705, partial [bacterium]|nr:hypothetical protein [bacterium]
MGSVDIVTLRKKVGASWRLFLLMCILMFRFAVGFSADRYAVATGNWTAGIWATTAGGVAGSAATPTAADVVFINSGVTVTINTAGATCASLTFTAPTANNGITMASPGTLAVTGAITMNSPTAGVITSTLAVGNGTLSAASIVIPGSATAGRFCTVSLSTGTINVSGNITFSGTTAAQRRFTFTGAGTLNIGGNFGSGGTLASVAGSTINFNGTTAQTAGIYTTYNVLKSNNTAGVTLLGNSTITTLTIGDQTPNSIFNDDGWTITLGGGSTLNLTNGTYNLGSATRASTWPAWGTRNISTGTTVGYVSGIAQTVSATPTYSNLVLSGAGAKTITTMTVNGNFTSSGGAITLTGNRTVTLGGNFNSASTFSSTTRMRVTLTGIGDQTISNSGGTTMGILTVNKASGSAILGSNLTATTYTHTAGIFDANTFLLTSTTP